MKDDIPFQLLEADQRIGGRVKTDRRDGFILNHGFQVLQTAYPEARRLLDYDRLALRPFAAGAIIRINGNFHRIADPWRHPQALCHNATSPDIVPSLRSPHPNQHIQFKHRLQHRALNKTRRHSQHKV